jgi:hypothetical protein
MKLLIQGVNQSQNNYFHKNEPPEIEPEKHHLYLYLRLLGVPPDEKDAADDSNNRHYHANNSDIHRQSLTGGGASTTLEPLDSAGLTTPAASISSIMVAARL